MNKQLKIETIENRRKMHLMNTQLKIEMVENRRKKCIQAVKNWKGRKQKRKYINEQTLKI